MFNKRHYTNDSSHRIQLFFQDHDTTRWSYQWNVACY